VILVFDVGNSETTIGVFEGESVRAHWRVTTDAARTHDEVGIMLRSLLAADLIAVTELTGCAIASVVPPVTGPLVDACVRWLDVQPIVIDGNSKLPIRLQVDEPLTVGADRIVNTLAASRLFAVDAIVVDLGTATTFDCITADGAFLGGVIAPGVRASADTLVRKTAKLPATDLVAPTRVIGTRTEECIRAGVMFGQAEAIDGIVRRIRAEWPGGRRPLCIATGGLADLFKPLCTSFDRVEPYLTLNGLRLAYAHLAGK
jgi:type III pantothenate kinase